ncbi:uncharacterized protein LOC125582479 [Brassica napus]|uniref:uncharacterized protein LOC125582479 n=1 Tax=Brassica napus TaxID=3708 RepID=UPI0020787A61|nr:uncharacterized protein LOC125582479 [Brassica napus]
MAEAEMDPKEVPADPPPVIRLGGKSWVSVAQEKQVLKKYEIDISVKEGKHSVEVPAEIMEQPNPLWEDFVIARFLDTAPHIAKVHMIVNKIWAYGEKSQKLDVIEMDERTMRIRITNGRIKEKVLRRGMWNVAGVQMVVARWSPDVADPNESLIPLWVHLTNVPLNMYSWKGLSFMTSAVGIPDHLHPETLACTNFEVAKILVKADLLKELPKRIDFIIQGEKVEVDFAYPGLPPRCINCGKWGHYETFCKVKKMVMGEELKSPKTPVAATVMKGNVDTEIVQIALEKDKRGHDEVMSLSGGSKERTSLVEGTSKESILEDGEINEWKKVSGEVRRTPKPQSLKYDQESIATPFRFAALSNTNEKGEAIATEDIEESEEVGTEEEEDIFQSRIEDSVEAREKGEFFCSFIYALNSMEERKDLWNDLRSHGEAQMFRNRKWILMGDYNEILEGEEHSGFADSPRIPLGMRDFQEVVNMCQLTDMGYQGPRYTWCNKREEGVICKKLDRVLVNEDWINNSGAYCVFESGGCSDHLRCRIHLKRVEAPKRKPFKFTNAIARMPEFIPLMEDNWKEYEDLYVSTSAMFMLTKRLKALKQPLRELSKRKLGDLPRRTKEAFKELCMKQQITMENPSAENIRVEGVAEEK